MAQITRMAYTEPSRWRCDKCGEWIESAEDGWLEWDLESNPPFAKFAFRIVHHLPASPLEGKDGCNDHANLSGNHLSYFVGQDGLSRLLAFLDPRTNGIQSDPCQIRDLPDYVDIMRRLLIANYEEARQYWRDAAEAGFFDGNEIGAHDPETLTDILDEFGPKRTK
jgi:hypothetical protein